MECKLFYDFAKREYVPKLYDGKDKEGLYVGLGYIIHNGVNYSIRNPYQSEWDELARFSCKVSENDTLYDAIFSGLKDGKVEIICNDDTFGEPAAKIGDNWFYYRDGIEDEYNSFEEYLADNDIEFRAYEIEETMLDMANDWELFGDELSYYCSIIGIDAKEYFKD